MTIALAQLTDAQLTEIGWTNGQIKEVRKYHKIPGFRRNAHQRALCRRYSDAQRQVFTVTLDTRFTAVKAKKASKKAGRGVNWSLAEDTYAVVVYMAYFGRGSAHNNVKAVGEFQERFPQRDYGSVNMKFAQIRRHDSWDPCDGLGASRQVREILAQLDPDRFSA
jgi:hypothetical protein